MSREKKIFGQPHAPVVSRDARAYWIRRLQYQGGQNIVSIPVEVMRELGLYHGQAVVVSVRGEELILRPVTEFFFTGRREEK